MLREKYAAERDLHRIPLIIEGNEYYLSLQEPTMRFSLPLSKNSRPDLLLAENCSTSVMPKTKTCMLIQLVWRR